MSRIVLLLPLLALAACAGIPPPSGQSIPDALLSCRPEPPRPWADPAARVSERALAAWALDAASAGEECRRRLGAVREILKPNGQ